jgi:hypothetical protein
VKFDCEMPGGREIAPVKMGPTSAQLVWKVGIEGDAVTVVQDGTEVAQSGGV